MPESWQSFWKSHPWDPCRSSSERLPGHTGASQGMRIPMQSFIVKSSPCPVSPSFPAHSTLLLLSNHGG
ncbi:hypothetical protein CapIbe_002434 [Capra ibex]